MTRRELLGLTWRAAAGGVASFALAGCGAAAALPAASSAGASSAPPSSAVATSVAASPQASGAASSTVGKPSGSLRVASSSNAGSQTPIWLAENLEAFSKRGLTVTRQLMAGDLRTR